MQIVHEGGSDSEEPSVREENQNENMSQVEKKPHMAYYQDSQSEISSIHKANPVEAPVPDDDSNESVSQMKHSQADQQSDMASDRD